ncbi:hypothetical protein BN1708_011526 [Verticillium longisporum]|uniref:FAD dependent oxidoreductase domain-containing protein n=1 Tax=Verticillium longisporum TaxID=100787 RepID=A0A0G4L153_VERLO|nr:hypothetical protein BN1708_011526 [Verticillium longisporum]
MGNGVKKRKKATQALRALHPQATQSISPQLRTMDPQSKKNIVIVGGGIIGSTTAYFLSRHPKFNPALHKITLLEATSIAAGASGKAGGLLALWAYPQPLVPLSYRLHAELAAEHGGAERWGYRRVGCGSFDATVTRAKLDAVEQASAARAAAVPGANDGEEQKGWERLPKQDDAAEALLEDSVVPKDLDWGATAVATVAEVAVDGTLGAGDGGLGQVPVTLAELLLELDGLLLLARSVEVPDLDADLGRDVGATGDDAAATADEGLDGEVAHATKGHVAGALVPGGLGVGGQGDTGQLAVVAAGELGADDVLVLGEPDEKVAVHVDAGDGARVVVENERDGALVGDGDEVVVNGSLVHLGAEVRRGQDEGVVGAGGRGQLQKLNGAANTAFGGTEDDGGLLEAGSVESLAGGLGDGNLLLAGAVGSLAVGAHGDEAGKASARQTLGVLLDDGDIEVFGLGVEEGHGRGVNADRQRPGGRVAVGTVGGSHDEDW